MATTTPIATSCACRCCRCCASAGRMRLRHWRNALLDYARQHALHWIEDPSNGHDHADRNFLRL
ncbi:hypothetical protein C7E18_23160, partial [Stenotrophomonas maltophilia]